MVLNLIVLIQLCLASKSFHQIIDLMFNNVLVTSHQGFFTREALENIARTTLDNIRAFAAGGPLVNEVSFGA